MGLRTKPPVSVGPPARRAGGFTLLEIMVAMILLAVIVTSTVSLLFINIRGWNGLVSDSERSLDDTLIEHRLQAMLRQTVPLIWAEAGDRRLAFEGEPKGVHFISRAPQQYRAGGLFEYLLIEERDSENRQGLVLYYAPYYPEQTRFMLPEGGQRRWLKTDTGGVTFAFFGSQRRGQPDEWSENWSSDSESYPRMVQIRFAAEGEGGEASPRFVRLMTPGAASATRYVR